MNTPAELSGLTLGQQGPNRKYEGLHGTIETWPLGRLVHETVNYDD